MEKPEILYEDEAVVVAVKPPGMPSQPDRRLSMDMQNWLRGLAAKAGEKPQIYVVHRLDRPVGGVMVFAKSAKDAANLSEQLRTGVMRKEYVAVLTGSLLREDAWRSMENYILRGKNNISELAGGPVKGAQKAVLEYRVLSVHRNEETGGKLSLVRIHLLTGRHHQIRVQMAGAGAGIWGDTKYNPLFAGKKEYNKLALFSDTLEFFHPRTGKKMHFEARWPQSITDHFAQSE